MAVKEIVLQLRTVDIDRALAFYIDELGFTLSFRYEDFYAGIETAGYMVHLKLVDNPDPGIDFVRRGEHLHLNITVDDIESEYGRIREAGVTIREELTIKPWNMREFVVEDPDGHTIYFSQPV
jgi:catechol 2,3-dioxygenase-like lactoylglutathione lyase family enzyme